MLKSRKLASEKTKNLRLSLNVESCNVPKNILNYKNIPWLPVVLMQLPTRNWKINFQKTGRKLYGVHDPDFFIRCPIFSIWLKQLELHARRSINWWKIMPCAFLLLNLINSTRNGKLWLLIGPEVGMFVSGKRLGGSLPVRDLYRTIKSHPENLWKLINICLAKTYFFAEPPPPPPLFFFG